MSCYINKRTWRFIHLALYKQYFRLRDKLVLSDLVFYYDELAR